MSRRGSIAEGGRRAAPLTFDGWLCACCRAAIGVPIAFAAADHGVISRAAAA